MSEVSGHVCMVAHVHMVGKGTSKLFHLKFDLNRRRAWDCRGGYDKFFFDITNALDADAADGEHEIFVDVFDPTEFGDRNLIGKQRANVRAQASVNAPMLSMSHGGNLTYIFLFSKCLGVQHSNMQKVIIHSQTMSHEALQS